MPPTPRVLVAVGSKAGATREIGERIAAKLREAGIDAQAQPIPGAPSPDGYDAVVLGSAVYAGRWMPDALDYAQRHEAALRARPLWIFSSGPVGFKLPESADSTGLAEKLRAREHRVFGGVSDPARTGAVSRLILRVMRAPPGDYRPWPEIEAWARAIAAQLAPGVAA